MSNLNPDHVNWTPEEKETLRRAFDAGGFPAARAALPARTRSAISCRAKRMGLKVRPTWTPEDDARLRALWTSELTLAEMSAKLGRTPCAVHRRSDHLGLPRCPDGWESMTAAVVRTGYTIDALRKILAADGAVVRTALADPRAKIKEKYRHTFVSRAQVDAAVAAWLESEPVNTAARRLGMVEPTLRRWLRRAGVVEPPILGRPRKNGRRRSRWWRVSHDELARALAYGESIRTERRGARAPAIETLEAA